jgi:hypothetical protein
MTRFITAVYPFGTDPADSEHTASIFDGPIESAHRLPHGEYWATSKDEDGAPHEGLLAVPQIGHDIGHHRAGALLSVGLPLATWRCSPECPSCYPPWSLDSKARVSYWFGGLWLWECADPTCPAIEFASSAGQAGDDAREHMRGHAGVR